MHMHTSYNVSSVFLLDINKLMYLERIERNGEDFDEFFSWYKLKNLEQRKGPKAGKYSTFHI